MSLSPCPRCNTKLKSLVVDVRESPAGRRRRRACVSCSHRWTTLEIRVSDSRGLYDMLRWTSSALHRANVQLTDLISAFDKDPPVPPAEKQK